MSSVPPKVKGADMIHNASEVLCTSSTGNIRVSTDEHNVRLYEVLNGENSIRCNWQIGDKTCSVTVNIRDDGKVVYSNQSEGLTYEDLKGHNVVKIKIGTERKMTLSELALFCKSEIAQVTTSLANIKSEKAALNELDK